MRYFITGGAGFIGSYVVDRLIAGAEVTVYDNLSYGQPEFIQHHFGRKGFSFIKADIQDAKTLTSAMSGHDCVFHLASGTDIRQGTATIDFDLKNGTIGTYNVLVAMKENGIKKLVFSSSATVYGDAPAGPPVAEDYGPLFPISLYGASKLACEGLITAFCHLFGMQAWMFRFSNVVGKRQTHGVIVDFIRKLRGNPRELIVLGDGSQERPFFLVDDCVNGILFAAERYRGQVDVFNLGCASTTTVTAIAEMVVQEMGLKDVKFTYTGGNRGWPGDAPQVHYNVGKMARLGWTTRYTSDEACRLTIRDILGKGG